MAKRQLGDCHHNLNHNNHCRNNINNTQAHHDDKRNASAARNRNHSRPLGYNDNGRGERIHLDRVEYFNDATRVVVDR